MFSRGCRGSQGDGRHVLVGEGVVGSKWEFGSFGGDGYHGSRLKLGRILAQRDGVSRRGCAAVGDHEGLHTEGRIGGNYRGNVAGAVSRKHIAGASAYRDGKVFG